PVAGFDEAALRASGPPSTGRAGHYWVRKLRAAFLAGDLSGALAAAERAQSLGGELAGQIAARDLHLYRSLALAALCPQQSPAQREIWLTEIRAHERRLRRWSAINPRTFRANLELVAAELAGLTGRLDEAARLYDESARWAAESGNLPDQALAH